MSYVDLRLGKALSDDRLAEARVMASRRRQVSANAKRLDQRRKQRATNSGRKHSRAA